MLTAPHPDPDLPAGHGQAPPAPAARPPRRYRPVHVGLAIAVGAALVWATSPVDDLDAYWHVAIGRQILAQHSLTGLGTSWLAVPAPGWTTSQWLSEVAMALAVDHAGWRALVVGRLVLALAVVASLWWAALRRSPIVLVTPVALLLTGALYTFAQDRPQTVSLIFLPWVAVWAHGLLRSGRRPPLVAVAAVSLLWAQLHGLWVLMPAAFLLAVAGCALDGPRRRRADLRAGVLAAACACAGVVNPQGWGAFLAPLRFRSSTAQISEWRPTTLSGGFVFCFVALALLTTLSWTTAAGRGPARSDRLWTLAWALFAALAFRDVPVAAIMVTPAALAALEHRWGARLRTDRPPSGRIESAVLGTICLLAVLVSGAVVVERTATLDPLHVTPALQISRRIAREPGPVRVWNDYNVSGSLIAFGAGKPRLVIDGRADLWGNARIVAVSGVAALMPGWEQQLRDFRPDRIVLLEDAPLVTLLTREGSWRTVLVDGDYALLEPASRA